MANYNDIKNAALIAPTTTPDLGSATNRYGNVYMSGNINMNGTTVTSTNVITPKVTSIGYIGDDTAADIAGGQTITLNGTGFASGASVLIAGTVVSVVSFVSSTQLTLVTPVLAAGSYVLYVVNPDGGTAISIPGIQYSGVPAWSTSAGTLGSAATSTAINITLAATGDAPVTYSVFSGTLPPGVTLNSSTGFLSGTTPSVTVETTYNFVIRATDLQKQDTNRNFSFTVTVYVGKLYTWGRNFAGRLGQGDTLNKSSPVQVGSLINWSTVAGKDYSEFAIKTDSTLWAWGNNGQGQLGLSDITYRSSPVQVGSLSNWSTISCWSLHSIAIKTDGTLWSWGYNSYGTLGLGDVVAKSSPVQVGLLTTWSKVVMGNHWTTATKTDGTLWAWGNNAYGQLGQGNTFNKSSPVQVGSLTTWLSIANGKHNLVAIKTDGTLWAWGRNNNGQLGLSDSGAGTNRYTPVQVGALTTWLNIASGQYHTIATKTDGTLWTWGGNGYGQLALNNTAYKSSPNQVGSLTNWKDIDGGLYHTVATKTDGTLWTWGRNNLGQLGLGNANATNILSPAQVGSLTNWLKIASGSYSISAISS